MLRQTGLFLSFTFSVFAAEAQYCVPEYTVGVADFDYIDGFELNTINNLSSAEGDGTGYSDFTGLSTEIIISETYSIHIVNTPSYAEYYRCWIDYNHNTIFSDDEEIFTTFLLPAGDEINVDFTVPFIATPGITLLRIRCVYGTSDFDACNEQTYGETEDYSVITGGLFTHDLALASMDDIMNACELSNSELISINISNLGSENESGFNVNYSVDGGPTVTETFVSTINSGENSIYTFSTGADLSADGVHTINCWTSLVTDELDENDSASTIVRNIFTYLTTGFPLNICYSGENIIPVPLATGGIWSGDGIINASSGELDPSLVGGIGSNTDITYTFNPISEYTVSEIPYTKYNLILHEELSLGDDDFEDDINIGFDFTFFGITYDKLFISSNGLIGFGSGSSSYTVQHFPDTDNPSNVIAYSWSDLNPSAGGDMKYETQGLAPLRRFVLDLNEVAYYADPQTVTIQVILYETSNAIDFQVTDIQSNGDDMTQGIENVDGTIAYVTNEIYNKEPFSMFEMGWRFAVTPCDATVTETINFIEPPVVELDSAEVCAGTIVILDAGSGAESYFWNTGATTQTIDVLTSGTYWVIYYSNISCFVEDSTTIIVNPLPSFDLGAGGIICEGTMLDAENPGSEYSWNTGATSQTIFVEESGTYYVEVITPEGCENNDTVDVTIIPLPVASYTTFSASPLTLEFISSEIGISTWYWDFGDGTYSFIENPIHTFPYADDWDITLVVTNDCGSAIATGIVQVNTTIQNNGGKYKVAIYPNPANDYVNINFDGFIASDEIEIYLYSLQGQLLLQQNILAQPLTTIKLNTEQLSAGDFMIVVRQDDSISCLPLSIAK